MAHKNIFNFLFLDTIIIQKNYLPILLKYTHIHLLYVLLHNSLILLIGLFINGSNLKQQDRDIKLKIVIQKDM